jgi:hypothetical protein
MSQVQLEAFFLVQNACTAFPSTFVSMLELSPPLPILTLLRVAGLSGLNIIIVNDRPVLPSERAHHMNKPATVCRWVLYSKRDWPTVVTKDSGSFKSGETEKIRPGTKNDCASENQ